MASDWRHGHNLMYFLIGFSHLTDCKVTDEEKAESIRIAGKYFGEHADWENIYREVFGEYLTDFGFPEATEEGLRKVQMLTVKCAEAWASQYDDEHESLGWLLLDAMSLANADGNFDEAELSLINNLAENWAVDIKSIVHSEISTSENTAT